MNASSQPLCLTLAAVVQFLCSNFPEQIRLNCRALLVSLFARLNFCVLLLFDRIAMNRNRIYDIRTDLS